MAFLHFVFLIVPWNSERTCQGTTVAPDAPFPIDGNGPGPIVLGNGPGGTPDHTGTVLAMHAGGRDIPNAGIGELSVFYLVNPSKYGLVFFGIDIVFVHAGHGTCATADTKLDVEIDGFFHSRPFPQFFSTLHRADLKPGTP